MDLPPAELDRVLQAVGKAAEAGRPVPKWPQYTDEYYWDVLIDKKPFRSYYVCRGGKQPLIDAPDKNLSQTPREQCELEGLVKHGLERSGPGQEVSLHSLKAAAHLNGSRGRVLPRSGPGAPKAAPATGRVAVRLTTGQEIACRPDNLRSPHSQSSSSSSAAASPSPGAGPSSISPGGIKPQLPRPTGPLADLIRKDVTQGQHPPHMDRWNWLQAGLASHDLKCAICGDSTQEYYTVMPRTIPDSPVPVPEAVKPRCVDCLIRKAEKEGVRSDPKAVEAFVDANTANTVKACMTLAGRHHTWWGGIYGSGMLY